MTKKSISKISFCILLCHSLLCVASQAQSLANSIWTGNAKLTLPKLNVYSDGDLLADPKTVSSLAMVLPVEVWFWDSTTFVVSVDMRKMNAAPFRPDLQPLLGQWTIPVAARVGALAGATEIPYGLGDYFEEKTGSYAFNTRTRRGTFKAQNKDTVTKDFDVGRITAGLVEILQGSFRLQGTNRMIATGTYTSNPNPEGPGSSFAYVGSLPAVEVTLVRHATRTPSGTGVIPFEPPLE